MWTFTRISKTFYCNSWSSRGRSLKAMLFSKINVHSLPDGVIQKKKKNIWDMCAYMCMGACGDLHPMQGRRQEFRKGGAEE